MTRIGMIGTGNMGGALLTGWSKNNHLTLSGFDMDKERLQILSKETGLRIKESIRELVEESDYIVLAVKPQQMHEVLEQVALDIQKNQCLISIAAGVKRETIGKWSGHTCPVVRVMPNTPALVGAGVFALCYDDRKLSAEQKDCIHDLFLQLGEVHVLKESYFDAFTALESTGPAYVFYFMESMVEAGVAVGFTRKQSREMIVSLLEGSAKMARESQQSAAVLREMVTSPAGTSSAAMRVLYKNAVRSSFVEAVVAAEKRSQELGEE
ncbi:MAG: pyrroline-5-carboxylate reductase [Desulfohalobiaceae bacterium]|nr:pyrroline-5-carboxylate reductase [Desulfohalobiaceae bacterium]